MKYISVCSGIEAATAAWHSMGWSPVAFSEIEPFPCAVLAHHYPDVPNLGDMTKYKEWPNYDAIDILVGGTPCQSFSVAGLRKGLADPRGNLMLTYLAIAKRYRPRWICWENVPGVLSSNKGRDFGAFLAGLAELGYGYAYRVLDAQYVRTREFPGAVPQRRRRVFVVGHLGDWRRAAAVLFDGASLRGDSPPSREAGKGVAPSLANRARGGGELGTDAECDGALIPAASGYTLSGHGEYKEGQGTLRAKGGDCGGGSEVLIPAVAGCITSRDAKSHNPDGTTPVHLVPVAFSAGNSKDSRSIALSVNHSPPLRGGASGTNMTPTVALPVAFNGDVARTLNARHDSSPCADRGMDVVAVAGTFKSRSRSGGWSQDVDLAAGGYMVPTCPAEVGPAMGASGPPYSRTGNERVESEALAVAGMQVRRLTPRECERLMGYSDGYTLVPYRNKPACDGPRYKALGNSMAVNVMQWIGQRIAHIEQGST